MTDIEYKELKERLEADGLVLVKDHTLNSKQYTYFKETNDYMDKLHNQGSLRAGYGKVWECIRRIVLWTYGAKQVKWMPDNKKEEANQLAIDILDLMVKNIKEQS